jgi:hypothetical protein
MRSGGLLASGQSEGTLEPGKLADLMIVKGDPLDDIRNTRNVHHVVKDGTVYDSRALLESMKGKLGPAGPDRGSPRNRLSPK